MDGGAETKICLIQWSEIVRENLRNLIKEEESGIRLGFWNNESEEIGEREEKGRRRGKKRGETTPRSSDFLQSEVNFDSQTKFLKEPSCSQARAYLVQNNFKKPFRNVFFEEKLQ